MSRGGRDRGPWRGLVRLRDGQRVSVAATKRNAWNDCKVFRVRVVVARDPQRVKVAGVLDGSYEEGTIRMCDEGIVWARGWTGPAVDALRAAVALR